MLRPGQYRQTFKFFFLGAAVKLRFAAATNWRWRVAAAAAAAAAVAAGCCLTAAVAASNVVLLRCRFENAEVQKNRRVSERHLPPPLEEEDK